MRLSDRAATVVSTNASAAITPLQNECFDRPFMAASTARAAAPPRRVLNTRRAELSLNWRWFVRWRPHALVRMTAISSLGGALLEHGHEHGRSPLAPAGLTCGRGPRGADVTRTHPHRSLDLCPG